MRQTRHFSGFAVLPECAALRPIRDSDTPANRLGGPVRFTGGSPLMLPVTCGREMFGTTWVDRTNVVNRAITAVSARRTAVRAPAVGTLRARCLLRTGTPDDVHSFRAGFGVRRLSRFVVRFAALPSPLRSAARLQGLPSASAPGPAWEDDDCLRISRLQVQRPAGSAGPGALPGHLHPGRPSITLAVGTAWVERQSSQVPAGRTAGDQRLRRRPRSNKALDTH